MKKFFYPSWCIECKKEGEMICKGCRTHLELLSPQNRCRRCFAIESAQECCNCSYSLTRFAAVFDAIGPALALFYELEKNDSPELIQLLSSFLFLQHYRLQWKKPDFIVPASLNLLYRLRIGFDYNRLLAKELAKLTECQYGRTEDIRDKSILLVGASYNVEMLKVADTLMEHKPKHVCGISLILSNNTITEN